MPMFRGALNDFDRFPFGKYRDEMLSDIPNAYYRWLRDQEWLSSWPALKRYVELHDWGEDEDDNEDVEYRD